MFLGCILGVFDETRLEGRQYSPRSFEFPTCAARPRVDPLFPPQRLRELPALPSYVALGLATFCDSSRKPSVGKGAVPCLDRPVTAVVVGRRHVVDWGGPKGPISTCLVFGLVSARQAPWAARGRPWSSCKTARGTPAHGVGAGAIVAGVVLLSSSSPPLSSAPSSAQTPQKVFNPTNQISGIVVGNSIVKVEIGKLVVVGHCQWTNPSGRGPLRRHVLTRQANRQPFAS